MPVPPVQLDRAVVEVDGCCELSEEDSSDVLLTDALVFTKERDSLPTDDELLLVVLPSDYRQPSTLVAASLDAARGIDRIPSETPTWDAAAGRNPEQDGRGCGAHRIGRVTRTDCARA